MSVNISAGKNMQPFLFHCLDTPLFYYLFPLITNPIKYLLPQQLITENLTGYYTSFQ